MPDPTARSPDTALPAALPCERPVPKARRYPGWVGDDDAARERYDLSLAIAAEAMQEPPTSAAALMAAEFVFNMECPTR